MQQATLAIRARIPLDVLSDTIQPFPTFSEIYVAALKALRHEIAAASARTGDTMTAHPSRSASRLLGQTVVVIGGSAGIGLETARLARAEGADVILTARNPERLQQRRGRARRAEHAPRSTPPTRPRSSASSRTCRAPVDHVIVTAGGPTTRRWRRWTSTRRAGSSAGSSGR